MVACKNAFDMFLLSLNSEMIFTIIQWEVPIS